MKRIAAYLALGLWLPAGVASAFAEDVCPADTGGWVACSYRPCPAGDEGQLCESIDLVTTFVSQLLKSGGSRSTVHFDATYYLAQAAGFTPRDAYIVAAYDAAVDLGQFELRGPQGELAVDPSECGGDNPPAECELVTPIIMGVNRNNFTSGGVFFHFMAPGSAANAQDNGMAPPTNQSSEEPFLDHVRRWAYGLGPLCVDGITNPAADGDIAEGASCFKSTTRTNSEVVGIIPFVSELGYLGSLEWISPLGEQSIATDPLTGHNMPASMLDHYVPSQDVPLAQLGIYLHAVADRISHHICIDNSQMVGPRAADAPPILLNPIPYDLYTTLLNSDSLQAILAQLVNINLVENPDFVEKFSNAQCDQLDHAQRHSWETGVDQSTLAAADRTTEAALSEIYGELSNYSAYYLFPAAGVTSSQGEQAAIATLVSALETHDPTQRLAALTTAAKAQGWLPLPLYDGITTEQWFTQAGAAFFSNSSSSSGGSSSGGSSGSSSSGAASGSGSGGGAVATDVLVFGCLMALFGRRLRKIKCLKSRHAFNS